MSVRGGSGQQDRLSCAGGGSRHSRAASACDECWQSSPVWKLTRVQKPKLTAGHLTDGLLLLTFEKELGMAGCEHRIPPEVSALHLRHGCTWSMQTPTSGRPRLRGDTLYLARLMLHAAHCSMHGIQCDCWHYRTGPGELQHKAPWAGCMATWQLDVGRPQA